MKRQGILNADLSGVIAELGHTDSLVICDAGLPIPSSVHRIDLALIKGIPGFIEVLKGVLQDTVVEKAIFASEIIEVSPELHEQTLEILSDIPVEYISHEEFKKMTHNAKGIVRSGETTPYANIILISGVDF